MKISRDDFKNIKVSIYLLFRDKFFYFFFLLQFIQRFHKIITWISYYLNRGILIVFIFTTLTVKQSPVRAEKKLLLQAITTFNLAVPQFHSSPFKTQQSPIRYGC